MRIIDAKTVVISEAMSWWSVHIQKYTKTVQETVHASGHSDCNQSSDKFSLWHGEVILTTNESTIKE